MTRCLRCSGCLHWEQDEWNGPMVQICINCGNRVFTTPPLPLEPSKQGPFLPRIVEVS